MLKKFFIKYQEIIVYVIFGVLTTAVNLAVYFGLKYIGVYYLISNITAWIAGVLFAYVTNRKYVFYSKITGAKEIIREMALFFAGRLFSGAADMILMYTCVDLLKFDDGISKIVINIIVIIINYLVSKLIVFKDNQKGEK